MSLVTDRASFGTTITDNNNDNDNGGPIILVFDTKDRDGKGKNTVPTSIGGTRRSRHFPHYCNIRLQCADLYGMKGWVRETRLTTGPSPSDPDNEKVSGVLYSSERKFRSRGLDSLDASSHPVPSTTTKRPEF